MATILIIDDSPAFLQEIRALLEDEGTFDTILEATDGLSGLKRLLSDPVDLVLCDLEMPGLDGEKLLGMRDSSPGGAQTPFLFVTANANPERNARLLRNGACDTISKPFHPAELLARLQLHLKMARLERELREKNEMLTRISSTDSLSGLRNRRYVEGILAVEFEKARRYRTPLALIMLDLDHFKQVNDTHGHLVGDAVLCAVSDHIRTAMRQTDVAGRFGGEEFLLILPHTDLEGGRVVAERLRHLVAQRPVEVAGTMIPVTASLGVAAFRETLTVPDDLLGAADACLYRAKEGGRNCVEVDG